MRLARQQALLQVYLQRDRRLQLSQMGSRSRSRHPPSHSRYPRSSLPRGAAVSRPLSSHSRAATADVPSSSQPMPPQRRRRPQQRAASAALRRSARTTSCPCCSQQQSPHLSANASSQPPISSPSTQLPSPLRPCGPRPKQASMSSTESEGEEREMRESEHGEQQQLGGDEGQAADERTVFLQLMQQQLPPHGTPAW